MPKKDPSKTVCVDGGNEKVESGRPGDEKVRNVMVAVLWWVWHWRVWLLEVQLMMGRMTVSGRYIAESLRPIVRDPVPFCVVFRSSESIFASRSPISSSVSKTEDNAPCEPRTARTENAIVDVSNTPSPNHDDGDRVGSSVARVCYVSERMREIMAER